jgi:transcriptional regulator GlxA family with amidase domain
VLERRFRCQRRRGLADELRQMRLAVADERLLTSDEGLEAIALACGLGSAKHLCTVFRAHHHMTPMAWRRLARSG